MSNHKTHDNYEPVIPRNRFLTDPVVCIVGYYEVRLRAAKYFNADEKLFDFLEEVISLYEKHDIDTPAIWTLDRKMVAFCSELLDVYEKHRVGDNPEWEEFLN